jgi:hypothetical protein
MFDVALEPHILPERVTKERAREARLFLQKHSGFEFEIFRRNIEVERLICKPLGDTVECLSAEDIANVIRSHMQEAPETLDPALIGRAVSHIESCATCFDNISAYQQMECRSLEGALALDTEAFPPLLWIGPVGRVEVIEGSNPSLGLWVAMNRSGALKHDLRRPARVRVSCPFETKEVPLHHVKWTWMSAKRPRARSRRMIEAYYRTDRLAELEHVKDQTCSFVSISQQVGEKELHSTRVIRIEKGNRPAEGSPVRVFD